MFHQLHKKTIINSLVLIFTILFILVFPHNSFSSNYSNELSIRTGLLSGKYSGQFKDSFTIASTFDIDYQFTRTRRQANYFRFTMALDYPDSRPFYTYTGTGYRFFLNSIGRDFLGQEESVIMSLSPRLRFFLAPEFGVAQVIVKSFGPTIQSVSNLFEIGVHSGAILQITRRLSAEIQPGITFGYGFSSVATTGINLRLLGGLRYAF